MVRPRASIWIFGLLVPSILLAGCFLDPSVRKQKYFESGERYSQEGKYKEATIQYANAIKIDKNFANAHYSLAQAYLHLGQVGSAYEEFRRTVDLQPTNYHARLDLGNLLLIGGRVDKAQEQANAVMAAQPNNPDLHALLAAIALKSGQKEDALTEIQRALELDPNRASFHQNLALIETGDPSKTSSVESELKKSSMLDPKSVNPRLLLAALYAGSGHWAEAEQAARDAVSAAPKSLEARESLAQIFVREGNEPKAEAVLREAAIELADNPRAVTALADYYRRTGEFEKARAEFAMLAESHPKEVAVQEGYVRTLIEVKDFATAAKVVDQLMKKDNRDPQIAALNGVLLLNSGKVDEAFTVLRKAANDYPRDPFIQFWLGKAALAKGDLAQARTSFGQVETLDPSRLDARQQLATIAAQSGDMDMLSEIADKTIAAFPKVADGYLWRATAAMSRNSFDKAETDLKTAIALAPKNALPSLQLGRIRLAQERRSEAATLLEQALQNDPNSVEAMRLLLSYDLFQKQPERALARVNAQIAKCPANSSFLVFLARLQLQNKDLDQAAVTAQKALQINSGDSEAMMLFAQVEILRGQTSNAIASWERWSSQHPNDAGAFAILGTLEESSGDQLGAEKYYRKSLQIQPQQPLAANNLAYIMLQRGDNPDVALSLAQIARRGMPNSPNTADTLAWAYYHKAAYGFARDLLENALASDTNNATMQYHLGMVYGKLNSKSNAATHLKKSIAIAPDSPAAKDARVALQGLG